MDLTREEESDEEVQAMASARHQAKQHRGGGARAEDDVSHVCVHVCVVCVYVCVCVCCVCMCVCMFEHSVHCKM